MFGPLVEPVTLQLTGQGADHYAQVSVVGGRGQSGLESTGPLATGELRGLAVPFPPLASPLVEIVWSGAGLVQLSWTPVAGAMTYTVLGAPTVAGPWTPLLTTAGTSTTLTILNDELRLFQVIAGS